MGELQVWETAAAVLNLWNPTHFRGCASPEWGDTAAEQLVANKKTFSPNLLPGTFFLSESSVLSLDFLLPHWKSNIAGLSGLASS